MGGPRDRAATCASPASMGSWNPDADLSLRQIHNQAGLVTPDGMPLVWFGRLRGFSPLFRVYGPDLLLAACLNVPVSQGWSRYFYGGGPGVADKLAERLSARYPRLKVAGCSTPPFRALTSE